MNAAQRSDDRTMFTKSLRSVLLTSAMFATAYDTGNKPGWKLSADGKSIEMKDGNPIYVDASGTETVLDQNTVSRLNGEAKANRERAERAEAEAAKFKDLDPVKAKEALDALSKIDQKKLIDAGEVDKVRKEISDQYGAQITERDTKLAEAQTKLDGMTKATAFNSSKIVRDRLAVPQDMFFDSFGKNFKVENDKVVAYGSDGNRINSPTRIGEPANVDEALEILINNHPFKDSILKAPGHSGSGNNGGGGGHGTGRYVKRADFEKMVPAEQQDTAARAAKGELQITD